MADRLSIPLSDHVAHDWDAALCRPLTPGNETWRGTAWIRSGRRRPGLPLIGLGPLKRTQLPGIGGQGAPDRDVDDAWLLGDGQVRRKQSEGLATEAARCRGDDAVQLELVGGSGDEAALLVGVGIACGAEDHLVRQAQLDACRGVTQVRDVADGDGHGDERPRPDEVRSHAFNGLHQMAVGFDHDGGLRAAQVQHLEAAGRTPPPSGVGPAKVAGADVGVTVERPFDGGPGHACHACDQVAPRHIAPLLRLSTSRTTGSKSPCRSSSIGRRPPSPRLRPCSQISTPSGT